MQDRDIVAAIVAGDPAGLRTAFDRYAAGLFGYCRSLLADPADAADTVQDTFVIAAEKVAALRDRDRLRPWLYAVARSQCHRRLRAQPPAPLEAAGEVTGPPGDPGARLEQAELRDLVQAALRGLGPAEREIIELSLAQDLAGADLADVLGVPRNQAHAMASRARAHLETALAALLVARSGRDACGELAALLRGWDGRLTVLVRKRVTRHIRHCPACAARQRRELAPEALLGLLPVAALPAGLWHQVLGLLAGTSPAAVARRLAAGQRTGPLGPAGFPRPGPALLARPLSRPAHLMAQHAHRLSYQAQLAGHPARAVAAAVAGTAAVTGAAVLVLLPPPARVPPGHQPAAPSAAVPTQAAGASPADRGSPAAAGRPGKPGTAGPAAVAAGRPGAGGAPAGAGATAAGRLVISPASLTLRLSLSGPATGTLRLTAVGGPVTGYRLTVPALYRSVLRLSRSTGSLAAGHSAAVQVSAPGGLLPGAAVDVAPGGLAVPVSFQVGG